MLISLLALLMNTRANTVDDAYHLILRFLKTSPKPVEMLDDVLKMGAMGGFYTASEFYQVITSLSEDYPNNVTGLYKIGRTFQNRDIKAYKIGDLSKLIRLWGCKLGDFVYGSAPFARADELIHGSENYARGPV